LARWLLMVHDRSRENHFYLTHAALAQLLGCAAAASPVRQARCKEADSSVTAGAVSRCSTARAWKAHPVHATQR
jgi:hypothetical protein